MSRAARKRNDPIKSTVAELPPAERLARGDVVVSGRGAESRARVEDFAERLTPDERLAVAWLRIKAEAASFRPYKLSRFQRVGGGNHELVPLEYAESARKALWRMRDRIDHELWTVALYYVVFEETIENIGVRLGMSRGCITRRLRRGLSAIGVILRGRRS